KTAFFGSLLLVTTPLLNGAVIVVPISTSDQQLTQTGSAFAGNTSARAGGDGSNGYTFVLPFALPEIAAGEEIVSATLTLNLQGWTHFGAAQGDAQLFGIDRYNNSAAAVNATDWIDNRSTLGSISLGSGQSVLDSSLIPY